MHFLCICCCDKGKVSCGSFYVPYIHFHSFIPLTPKFDIDFRLNIEGYVSPSL